MSLYLRVICVVRCDAQSSISASSRRINLIGCVIECDASSPRDRGTNLARDAPYLIMALEVSGLLYCLGNVAISTRVLMKLCELIGNKAKTSNEIECRCL